MPSEGDIRKALQTVKYPGFNRDIVSFGLVKTVGIFNDNVHIELDVTTEDACIPGKIQEESERAIAALPGVGHVQVNVKRRSRTRLMSSPTAIENVRHVVAVASGKGGVGGRPRRTHVFCGDSRRLEPKSRGAIETPHCARDSVWSGEGAPQPRPGQFPPAER